MNDEFRTKIIEDYQNITMILLLISLIYFKNLIKDDE